MYDGLWQSLSVMSTSSLLPCDKGQCSLVGETPVKRIYDIRVPLRGSVFRQIKGIQRKLSPAFAGFQMPTAQNNRYTKAVYFGGGVSWTPTVILWVAYSAVLQVYPFGMDARPVGTTWRDPLEFEWDAHLKSRGHQCFLSRGGGDGCEELFLVTPRCKLLQGRGKLCRELEFPKCRVGLRGSCLQVTVAHRKTVAIHVYIYACNLSGEEERG